MIMVQPRCKRPDLKRGVKNLTVGAFVENRKALTLHSVFDRVVKVRFFK